MGQPGYVGRDLLPVHTCLSPQSHSFTQPGVSERQRTRLAGKAMLWRTCTKETTVPWLCVIDDGVAATNIVPLLPATAVSCVAGSACATQSDPHSIWQHSTSPA